MDPRDAKIFKNAFSEIFRIKSLLHSRQSYCSKNELLIKLQEHYGAIIFFDPLLSIERKFEVELWNTVFKGPLNACIEDLRKSTNSASAHELQQRLVSLIDRASGFYCTLMHKLLERLPDSAWTKNILETSFTLNAPPMGRVCWGGGRFDLDSVTLQTQLTRFTRKEKAAQLDATKFVNAIEDSQQRPIILPRGEKIPDSGFFGEPSSIRREVASPPKISLSEAVVYLIQHCCIHLGDLARYQHQHKTAVSYYISAWLVDPTCGHAYNQLGVIEATKTNPRTDSLCYFYVRAIACSFPFLFSRKNLKSVMDIVYDSTKNDLLRLSSNSSAQADLCESLLFPLPFFLRFHSVASSDSDIWTIVKAAEEFSLATSTFVSVIDSSSSSVDLSKLLDERAAELASDLAQVRSIAILPENLRKLQIRLLNTIVIHSFGLQTNWSKENEPALRQCLLYTTVCLIDWFCAVVMGVRNKCSGVENDLPIMPVLLTALALKAQCSFTETENRKLSDSEILEFAPPLSKSAVDFLNSLISVIPSKHVPVEDLSKVDLPELFALQGFIPMGIPAFKNSYQSGPYIDLMPHSFFDGDADTQATYYHQRVSLLVDSLRSVAGELPGLLKWSSVEQAFVCVDRVPPSLPQLPQHSVVEDAPEMEEICTLEPEISSEGSKDTQNKGVETGSGDQLEDVTESPSNVVGVSASREHAINNAFTSSNSSSVPVPFSSSCELRRMNDINTSELARFIQEQASQVAARQRKRLEEAARVDTRANHGYLTSKSNFQRDLPPRFSRIHEAEAVRSNLPGNANLFKSASSDGRQPKRYASTLFPGVLDRIPNQNIQPTLNGSAMPRAFEPSYPPPTLGIGPSSPQRWGFPSPLPFAGSTSWPRHSAQPPPPYFSTSVQQHQMFDGNVQENLYHLSQNTGTGSEQTLSKSAFT
ncbi:Protein SMG7 [Taenia crassiceps]|uniref:Protein SMG7 n=1 Tax=Taenia crassiceps TaxID=6207 RepID=A0ABR4QEF6_9CEST